MTQTIELPDLWLLVAPCGCFDGWMRVAFEGTVLRPTAEDALKDFAPTKRERDRLERQGFIVRGGDYHEWNNREVKGDCPHTPKWGMR